MCLGADEAESTGGPPAIGREPDELRANGVAGTPDEVAATLERWADAGAERLYLQVLDLADLDHLDAIAGLDLTLDGRCRSPVDRRGLGL